jgi:hypothetical protein
MSYRCYFGTRRPATIEPPRSSLKNPLVLSQAAMCRGRSRVLSQAHGAAVEGMNTKGVFEMRSRLVVDSVACNAPSDTLAHAGAVSLSKSL